MIPIEKYIDFLENSRLEPLNRGGASIIYIARLNPGRLSPYKREDGTEIREILIKGIIIDNKGAIYYYNRQGKPKDIQGTSNKAFNNEVAMQTRFSTEVPIAPSILYSSPNDPIFKEKILPAMFTAVVAKRLTGEVDKETFTCGIIVMEYFEMHQH